MTEILLFVAGVVFGALVVLAVLLLRRREARSVARELVAETEAQKIQDLEVLLGRVRDSFGALSFEALKRNTDEFLKLANEKFSQQAQLGEKDLEGKKRLIDQSLEAMKGDLLKVQELISGFERDRSQKYGELAAQLRQASEQTTRLQDTAEHLRQALSSTKARGQWGERMAEDVLRLAGFVEGVNYLKQKVAEAGGRPDYTFKLPQGRKVNMDVKFPLNNYLRFLEAEGDADRESAKTQFLRDVKERIKEVTGREYIDQSDNTLDYVLVFIPNEQVYAFINQSAPELMDEALKRKVILCSPFTLFAILAIIRQAMDNFSLERTAGDMLKFIGSFNLQWKKFVEALDKAGKKFEETHKEFETLRTTRRRQLERPLERIEKLRQEKGLEAAEPEADALLVEAAVVGDDTDDENDREK
ncbi:MAG: DNA recombination protein RmuC [Candidatus Aminicenantes bacterium]|nr:DNA recombination protein RmuC [Candidatus Aminicenantes bacterium]